MFKLVAFLCLILLGHSSQANIAKAGDGGQGVVCGKGLQRTIELLDLFEARNYYDLTPSLASGPASATDPAIAIATARDRARTVLGPNAGVDAIFDFAGAFNALGLKHNIGMDLWPLDYINDTGPIISKLPNGCKTVQLAIFSTDEDSTEPWVRLDYWFKEKASPIDLVGLYLHESAHIYFDTGKTNLPIRQFILFLTAPDEFRQRNIGNFIKLMQTRQALDPKDWH